MVYAGMEQLVIGLNNGIPGELYLSARPGRSDGRLTMVLLYHFVQQ